MAETSTVGGVISGYWATGRLKSATVPASVTRMDRTLAKIGRSMKKRVNMRGPAGQSVGGGKRAGLAAGVGGFGDALGAIVPAGRAEAVQVGEVVREAQKLSEIIGMSFGQSGHNPNPDPTELLIVWS